MKFKSLIVAILMIAGNLMMQVEPTQAFTLGCSKAQAQAQDAGLATSLSIQDESYHVDRSEYTEAYQEYLAANKFANAWKKIVSKSPKCFKEQIPKIEPIFKKFYSKASMCQRYGNAICKRYPSKLAPRKPLTLADICGKNPYSYSYLECVERLGEPDRSGYAD
jgi:hypothetical protein